LASQFHVVGIAKTTIGSVLASVLARVGRGTQRPCTDGCRDAKASDFHVIGCAGHTRSIGVLLFAGGMMAEQGKRTEVVRSTDPVQIALVGGGPDIGSNGFCFALALIQAHGKAQRASDVAQLSAGVLVFGFTRVSSSGVVQRVPAVDHSDGEAIHGVGGELEQVVLALIVARADMEIVFTK